jgi:hypothetical protein
VVSKSGANPVVLKDFTMVGAELFSCVFNCPKQEDNSEKAKCDSCFERNHLVLKIRGL